MSPAPDHAFATDYPAPVPAERLELPDRSGSLDSPPSVGLPSDSCSAPSSGYYPMPSLPVPANPTVPISSNHAPEEQLPRLRSKRLSPCREMEKEGDDEGDDSSEDSPPRGDNTDRKKKRLERNRKSARNSRRRKKEYMQSLEIQVRHASDLSVFRMTSCVKSWNITRRSLRSTYRLRPRPRLPPSGTTSPAFLPPILLTTPALATVS